MISLRYTPLYENEQFEGGNKSTETTNAYVNIF